MSDFQITVILISYNNFKYIFNALHSIFSQTYSNIQLIISDDGSSDFNLKRLKNYLNRNRTKNIVDLIINVNEQNKGTVKHLDELHKVCTGELITVLAADDAFADETVIESFAKEYLRYDKKIGVITSLLAMCDTKLEKVNSIFTSKQDMELINSGDSRRLFEELSYRCIMPSSGTVISPKVYEQVGSLTEDYAFIEDWSSHARMARDGIQIRCMDKVTVLHRDGGISHGNTRARYEAYLKYYKDLITIYEKEIEPYEDRLSILIKNKARVRYQGLCNRYSQLLTDYVPEENKKKIVFFFRKGVVAKGDFALYYCIAAQIAKDERYAVYCINNSSKELQEKYIDSGIHFCNITPENRKNFEGATFITAFNQLFFLLEELEHIKNGKVLLLFLHPQIYDWMAGQVPKSFNFNSVFKMLIKNKSYAFMDKGNLLAVQKHSKALFEPRYFPVVTDCQGNDNFLRKKDDRFYNIAWFGRLDGDKISSLLNFLDNIIGFDFGKPLTIHLIGDGGARMAIKFGKYAPQMRFVFNSFLYGEEKDKYLKENADMVVAMGISALDAALLKIPTVLTIVSPRSFKDNKFILFSDTKDYCLGVAREDIKEIDLKTYPAHKIVEMCCGEQHDVIGEQCYEYAINNFHIKNQIDNILDKINNASLTLRQCRQNKSIWMHFTKFKLYRKIRGNRNYAAYLKFRQKYKKFKNKSLKDKLHIKKFLGENKNV